MRRSLFAGIGVAAVLIFAACTQDQSRREPLAPADVGLAKGGGGGSPLCAGGLASDIAKLQDFIYAGTAELYVEDKFDDVKTACPLAAGDPILMTYLEAMIDSSGAPGANADSVAALLGRVTLYATGSALDRSASVFGALGGAAVLTVNESTSDAIVSYDLGARLLFGAGTLAITDSAPTPDATEPFGMRLFTFKPLTAEECGDLTGLRLSQRGEGAPCYDVQDYPDAVGYTPAATLTICMHKSIDETEGIVHDGGNFGDEVLPAVVNTFSCAGFHDNPLETSWLHRNGGPLGRALARAYNYLAPKTLNADDAGESGSLGFFSKVGGVLNDIFENDFNDSLVFNQNPAAASPDLGDADGGPEPWIYSAQSPGFIRIQTTLADMSGGVLVLSQGQGACNKCPVFKLLGEVKSVDEENTTGEVDRETNGSFEVSWKSVQTKPSVKEAPFVLLNNTLNSNNNNLSSVEIARVSYVSASSQNRLQFKVLTDSGCAGPPNAQCVRTIDAGPWTQNQSQSFRIVLNLTTLNPDSAKRVTLFVGTQEIANVRAVNASGFKLLGYVMTGIDAGIIGSDDWFVTRLADKPKP